MLVGSTGVPPVGETQSSILVQMGGISSYDITSITQELVGNTDSRPSRIPPQSESAFGQAPQVICVHI